MKSYHEVAEDVFRRRDAYVCKQQSKVLLCRRVTTIMLAVMFAAALLFSARAGYVYAVRKGIIDDHFDFFATTDVVYMVMDNGDIIHIRKIPDWGITLSAANVTPTGMTLTCTQSGGVPHGTLMTGQSFYLEVKTEAGWVGLQAKEGSNVWDVSGYAIPENGTVSWTVNWTDMYGELPAGTYRLRKPFWEGQYMHDALCYHYIAEFTIDEA